MLFVSLLLPAAVSAEQLDDPMRPGRIAPPAQTGNAPTAPRWTLSSTLVADGRQLAVINGQTVSRGQRVGGAEVIAVGPGYARLRHAGEEIELRLGSPVNVKRSVNE
jgi:hypothetical protein